jgi:hypothetical protein
MALKPNGYGGKLGLYTKTGESRFDSKITPSTMASGLASQHHLMWKFRSPQLQRNTSPLLLDPANSLYKRSNLLASYLIKSTYNNL